MRLAVSTGDECPGGSAVFHNTCFSGPKSTGSFVASGHALPVRAAEPAPALLHIARAAGGMAVAVTVTVT